MRILMREGSLVQIFLNEKKGLDYLTSKLHEICS